jgi:hypothetical protein
MDKKELNPNHQHDLVENWKLDNWYGYGYGYMVWDECKHCSVIFRKYWTDHLYTKKIEATNSEPTRTACL